MDYKFISCKCITYGRVHLLEESLHSFLKQDYPPDKCEIVIINDYPLQKLMFKHPQVRIINNNYTFDTIGSKENFATEQCYGDVICQWDDDDLAMPNHLLNVNKYFNNDSDLLHWHKAIFMNSGKISGIIGVGNSGIVYSKKAWKLVGGYPLENAGYDMTYVINIKTKSRNIVFAEPPENEVSWVYYWGGRGYHMSGLGTDTPERPNVIQRHSEYIESERKRGNIPIGDVVLNPHWNDDYMKLLNDYLINKK